MSRNLDGSLSAALSNKVIAPVILAALTLNSGVLYIWSGVGNLVYAGNTYLGVGMLGKISPISEGSGVTADGMSITLSGIGKSPFNDALIPPGVSNPATVPTGQFVAWAVPLSVSIFNVNETVGTIITANAADPASNTAASSFIEKTESASIGSNYCVGAAWSEFLLPTLPPGAVVQNIFPVVMAAEKWTNGNADIYYGPSVFVEPNGSLPTGSILMDGGVTLGSTFPSTEFFGNTYVANFGSSLDSLGDQVICATLSDSLNVVGINTLEVSFVGFAIYYTAPSNVPNLINQAIADIQIGAPAQIYFGLFNLDSCELIGNPYQVFKGQVDQPSINISTETASITLALENKLSNLLRPTARRYTAADQHLIYPDDIGFNWVEILNDIALRWGS